MPDMFSGPPDMPSPQPRPPSMYVPDWNSALEQAIAQQAPDYFSRTSGGGSPQGLANLAMAQLGAGAPMSLDALGMVQQYLAQGANPTLPAVAPAPGTTPEKKGTASGATEEERMAATGAAPGFMSGLT